ncbi:hypothetical protein EZS27_018257 [termite gut metagenome]|uniref:Glycosyltransferase 2-like domain-containing protein n=1 Tax=termite gut metagenome TaxID=433724 RepID=A0A5J4RKC3_9ZZZZ
MENLSPIVLFAFIRLDTLQKTVAALQNNYLASQSDLFVFVDGPRNEQDVESVLVVQEFCHTINGFKNIELNFNEKNIGLDVSIISGVTKIVNKYGSVIVLEDDIITARNFLNYMNQSLMFYKNDSRIMMISGFGLRVVKPFGYEYDVYMFGRSSSWGWGTWNERWNSIDWQISDWKQFRNNIKEIRSFNKWGGSDLYRMLKQYMRGRKGMWDIRVCYNMFKTKRYAIFPFVSKTQNIGFGENATHCKKVKFNRFIHDLDISDNIVFNLDENIIPNTTIIKKRLFYYSFILRLYYKIHNFLNI